VQRRFPAVQHRPDRGLGVHACLAGRNVRRRAGRPRRRLDRRGNRLRDLGRWGVPESVYEQAACRYAPADAPPLPDLPTEGPRYIRRTWGTCNFETLPAEKRQGLSCWSATINSGFYWCDGKRPLPALERLAAAETGNAKGVDLTRPFEAALEAGIMVEDNTDNFRKK